MFRRDRVGRRGGGVALYVLSTLQASVWKYSTDDRAYELHWVRVGNVFIAALYTIRRSLCMPLRLYSTTSKLVWKRWVVIFLLINIVIASDVKQLSEDDHSGADGFVADRTSVINLPEAPTFLIECSCHVCYYSTSSESWRLSLKVITKPSSCTRSKVNASNASQ